jgi:NitT/TauT family transport system ATP-binding protein
MASRFEITAGFMPLLDSALLVTAKEKGFASAEDIDLRLVRETSWANIRDRLAVGHFQVAHALAPMPIACNLGLTPLSVPTVAPMALGLGGNAVTVSLPLWQKMVDHGASADFDPLCVGRALKSAVTARTQAGLPPLRFAVVHPHSGHNYELRYCLAASGIAPNREVEIVFVPPPLMADALNIGSIDGYCAGEPWNTAAAVTGAGRIATVKAAIWRSSPEKVLAVPAAWADAHVEALERLLRALVKAAQWCEKAAHHEELANILGFAQYLGRPAAWMLPALSGKLHAGVDDICTVPDFFVLFAKAATFPWTSHALWFYSQMVRWGQVAHTAGNAAVARDTYRPDLYRAALKATGIAMPVANAKVEGALKSETPVGSAGASLTLGPDGFFDGGLFDPDQIDDYIAAQSVV